VGACGSATCRYWYLLDGRRNVVGLADKTGNVVDRYHYDLWGVPSIDAEAVKQPLLYAGYWYDRELHAPNAATGWYWLAVRPYDPALRRFTQPDPSMQEGIRSYVYVGDDPVDATDPSGLRGSPLCLLTSPEYYSCSSLEESKPCRQPRPSSGVESSGCIPGDRKRPSFLG